MDRYQLTARYELLCCAYCALPVLWLRVETEVELAPSEDDGDVPPFYRSALQRPELRECRFPVCLDAFDAVLSIFE